MIKKTRLVIAREGRLFVLAIIILAACLHYFASPIFAAPFWLWAALWAYMFRDTHRAIPPAPMGLVSPCDGQIISIEKAHDSYLNREAWKIRLKMNWWGEYAVRSPTEGRIMNQWYIPAGEKLFPPSETNADSQQAGKAESISPYKRYAIWVKTDEGDDIVLASETSRWTRPNWYVYEGWRVGQGQRCGYLPFGTDIELYVPMGTRIEKTPGQKIVAGCDVLATLRYPSYRAV